MQLSLIIGFSTALLDLRRQFGWENVCAVVVVARYPEVAAERASVLIGYEAIKKIKNSNTCPPIDWARD